MMIRVQPNSQLFCRVMYALFLLLLGLQPVLGAQKGARLRIQRADQSVAEGELVAVRETKLVLVDFASQDLTVDINEINLIVIDRKPHTWLGAGLGMVLGGIIGVAVAPSTSVENIEDIPLLPAEEVMSKTGYGMVGMLVGGVLGGLIGAGFGSDSQIAVAKMSPAERESLLVKLRSKARIKNAT